MSSLCRDSACMLALVAALCGCDREERHSRAKPLGETVPASLSPDTIGGTQSRADARAAAYEGNAYAIA